jgi:hypothetical protein
MLELTPEPDSTSGENKRKSYDGHGFEFAYEVLPHSRINVALHPTVNFNFIFDDKICVVCSFEIQMVVIFIF